MKSRHFLSICVALCVFTFGSAFDLAQTSASTPDKAAKDRAEAIRVADVWLDSVQTYQHIPAISAGVVVGRDLIWSKGFGTLDARPQVPATPQIYLFHLLDFQALYFSRTHAAL